MNSHIRNVLSMVGTLMLTSTGLVHSQTTVFHFRVNNSDRRDLPTIPSVGGSPGTAIGTTPFNTDIPSVGVPPGSGNRSLQGAGLPGGGVNSTGTQELLNTTVAANGGFTFECWFKWFGGGTVNSIIDYAGTEKFRIPSGTGFPLDMNFDSGSGPAILEAAPTTNEWHYVAMVFEHDGNEEIGGKIDGTMTWYYDSDEPVGSIPVIKDDFGDSLNRPIGVGRHPLGFGADNFDGLVYEPRVTLGALTSDQLLWTTDVTVPVITSITSKGEGSWELTLKAKPDTGYEFLSSTTLDFTPGTLVESLVQGDAPSDPGTVTDSKVLITDSNGDGTVRMMLTGDPADFVRARIPPPPPPLLSEDFEAGNGGFTVATTGPTAWARGAPTSSGDGGAITGGNGGSTNCWGTDIGSPGFYADVTDTCLRSTVIDLTGVAGAELTFAEALDLEAGDTAVVNIIEEATDTIIAAAIYTATDGNINTADWSAVPAIDLAAGVGRRVRIEWCLTSIAGGTNDYMGWYIDDVKVVPTTP